MKLPALKNIGGDLNCQGNKQMSENSLPNLETVGGKMILANAGFTKLPSSLKNVEGDVIISRQDPKTLLKDILEAKENGIIKGELFYCD